MKPIFTVMGMLDGPDAERLVNKLLAMNDGKDRITVLEEAISYFDEKVNSNPFALVYIAECKKRIEGIKKGNRDFFAMLSRDGIID